MLLWQRKNRASSRITYSLTSIILYVITAHCIVGIACLFLRWRAGGVITVQSVEHNVRIVCDPTLFKSSRYVAGSSAHVTEPAKSFMISEQQALLPKIQKQKTKKKELKKKVLKAPLSEKKVAQKTATKETKQLPKKEEKISAVIPVAPQQVNSEASAESILYVDKTTYDQMQIHKELHDALAHVWHPPRGMPTAAHCLIEITLDARGVVENYSVLQPSGYPVFDMAAKRAALTAVYPPFAWNKTIKITF